MFQRLRGGYRWAAEIWGNHLMTKDVLLQSAGDDLFVSINGIRIAKRRDPSMSQVGIWIPLKPGWSVLDGLHGDELIVSVDGVRVE